METRAFNIGYADGINSDKQNNKYKRTNKRMEYDLGFKFALKEKMKTLIKNKPQLFHNSIPSHNKKRMTIVISGGSIQDVVRENIDCELVVHDYDIDGIDVESNVNCHQDIHGNYYQEIHVV